MFLLKIAGSVMSKLGGIRHVRWIVLFYCCSGFCTLSTTGTDVQGIIPTSVITMETKWGGVTSYMRFSKWRELMSRQSDRTSGLSLDSGTKSSGSPGGKIVKSRIILHISHLDPTHDYNVTTALVCLLANVFLRYRGKISAQLERKFLFQQGNQQTGNVIRRDF